MAIRATALTSFLVLASAAIPVAVKADTVNARCDIYPLRSDQVSEVTSRTFSQRQGAVGIQLEDGRRYDLRPVGDQPGNYIDQNGQAAYRQAGLEDRGQIYQVANERIFVYWDDSISSASASPQIAQANPVTYTTVQSTGGIAIQITDGNFRFYDILQPGETGYIGQDGIAKVNFTPNDGHVVVYSAETGETFYDYYIEPVSVGPSSAVPAVQPASASVSSGARTIHP